MGSGVAQSLETLGILYGNREVRGQGMPEVPHLRQGRYGAGGSGACPAFFAEGE